MFAIAAWVVLSVAVSYAAGPSNDEYHVKGAFLLNFARFVDWPSQAFKGPEDPISICLMGENPFGPALDRAAHSMTVASRGVSVREVTDGQQCSQCNIVFVSGPERKRARKLIEAVQGQSVLTVGESEGFVDSGGVIGFRLDGERVRIEISTEAASRARLHISAKLLSLAQAGTK